MQLERDKLSESLLDKNSTILQDKSNISLNQSPSQKKPLLVMNLDIADGL